MKYAVISINNNQYKVKEGEEVLIDRIDEKDIDPKALLLVDEDDVQIGKPYLNKAKIELEYLGEESGKKLHVRKFRAKSRYRRKIGFKPKYTRVKVKELSA